MPQIHPALPADGDDAIVEPYNAAINQILGVINGSVDSDNIAAGAVTLSALSAALQATLVPTALISPYGGASAPTGWLLCDGSSYLRASYSSLFATIGTSYGSADGTHFNVPDLRGRSPIGNDAMGGTAANITQRTTTITTTSGSANATVGSITGITKGMLIKSTNVPAGTTVISFNSTAIVMSANASATGSAIAARFSLLADAAALGSTGGADITTLAYSQLPWLGTNLVVSEATFTGNLAFPAAGNAMGYNSALRTGLASAVNGSLGEPAPNLSPLLVTNFLIKT